MANLLEVHPDVALFSGDEFLGPNFQINDALREGSSTVIVTSELKYGVELEDEVFSLRWLERGG